MRIKQYGLIGKSLSHSFSQAYFTEKFNTLNINAVYNNIEVDTSEDLSLVFNTDLAGANVTIPYKTSIIPYLDALDETASAVGAVNTIKFENTKKIGYNTDTYGFKQLIKPFFKSHHERALILGTGGASKAVAFVLENLGVNVIYVSRNPKGENQFPYEAINENMIAFNGVIVNTTPVGMYPNIEECIALPYHALTDKHLVIDLIYNPKETLFLTKAKQQKATILNGLTMLHQQAEKAWEIWNK